MNIQDMLNSRIGYGVRTIKDVFVLYTFLRIFKVANATRNYLESYNQYTIEALFRAPDRGLGDILSDEKARIQQIFNSQQPLLRKLYALSDFSKIEDELGKSFAAKLNNAIRSCLDVSSYNSSVYGTNPRTIIMIYQILSDAIYDTFIKFIFRSICIGSSCYIYNIAITGIPIKIASILQVSSISNALSKLPTAHSVATSFDELYYRFNFMRILFTLITLSFNNRTSNTETNHTISDKEMEDKINTIVGTFYIVVNTACDYIKKYYHIENKVLKQGLTVGISAMQVAWKAWKLNLYDIVAKIVDTFYASGHSSAGDFALQTLSPLALATLVNIKVGFKFWEPNLMSFQSKNLNVTKYVATIGIVGIGIKYGIDIYRKIYGQNVSVEAQPVFVLSSDILRIIPDEEIQNILSRLEIRLQSGQPLRSYVEEEAESRQNDVQDDAMQNEAPKEYICPILGTIMRDPVFLLEDGHVYERKAIEGWLMRNPTSPINRAQVNLHRPIPSHTVLKVLIDEYLTNHTLPGTQQQNGNIKVPEAYLCPLSKKIMREPIVLADGYAYEKEKIENVLQERGIVTLKNETMINLVYPRTISIELKSLIEQFLEQHESNINDEIVYLPVAWQKAWFQAVKEDNLAAVKELLAKDKRLLRLTLNQQTSFDIACQAKTFTVAFFILERLQRPEHHHLLQQFQLKENDLKKLLLNTIEIEDNEQFIAKTGILSKAGITLDLLKQIMDEQNNTLSDLKARVLAQRDIIVNVISKTTINVPLNLAQNIDFIQQQIDTLFEDLENEILHAPIVINLTNSALDFIKICEGLQKQAKVMKALEQIFAKENAIIMRSKQIVKESLLYFNSMLEQAKKQGKVDRIAAYEENVKKLELVTSGCTIA